MIIEHIRLGRFPSYRRMWYNVNTLTRYFRINIERKHMQMKYVGYYNGEIDPSRK